MKTIKRSLVASALLSLIAGAAHAAVIASFNVAETDVINSSSLPPPPVGAVVPNLSPASSTVLGSGTGYGTATLDDSGVVTMNLTDTFSTTLLSSPVTQTTQVTMTGLWDGTAFTPSSGAIQQTSCPGGGSVQTCLLPLPQPFIGVGGSTTLMGGVLSSTLDSMISGTNVAIASTYSLTAVPVPAAAWLFGTGILGLAGTARRKSKNA